MLSLALLCVAICLAIYVGIVTKYPSLCEEDNLKKTRKIWYAFCLLGLAAYVHFKPVHSEQGYNKLLIPNEIWDLVIVFIIFIVFAVLVDVLILRTTNLGEFRLGGFGGRFEETRQNIKEQLHNMDMVLNKIEAEHEVIQNLDGFLQPLKDKIDQGDVIDWLSEINDFLNAYCQVQNYNVEVNVYDTDEPSLEELKEHFKLLKAKYRELKRNIQSKTTTFCESAGYEILFIPVESSYYENDLIIALRGKNNIFAAEQFIILNLYKLFELYVYYTVETVEEIPDTEPTTN